MVILKVTLALGDKMIVYNITLRIYPIRPAWVTKYTFFFSFIIALVSMFTVPTSYCVFSATPLFYFYLSYTQQKKNEDDPPSEDD
jgi:hypothetical protein